MSILQGPILGPSLFIMFVNDLRLASMDLDKLVRIINQVFQMKTQKGYL